MAGYDGMGIYRNDGEGFYDSHGIYRRPSEGFYDSQGIYRKGQYCKLTLILIQMHPLLK